MRMPAIQTLMLFAKKIATNSTLTKIVFDNFLLIHAPLFGQGNVFIFDFLDVFVYFTGKTLLFQSISLRKKWISQLEKKLRNDELNDEAIFNLKKDVINFMNTEISYNIKRLLPADLKTIFSNNADFEILKHCIKNPFDRDFNITVNNKYGGLNVTDYVIYNCLIPEEWDDAIEIQVLDSPFSCGNCQNMYLGHSMLKIFHHEKFCGVNIKTEITEEQKYDHKFKQNSKLFHCDVCSSDLYLTPTDILKHKKSCK